MGKMEWFCYIVSVIHIIVAAERRCSIFQIAGTDNWIDSDAKCVVVYSDK